MLKFTKRARSRRTNTEGGKGQRQPRRRDARHLQAVAGLPSVVSGREPCQVCHIRFSDHATGKINPGMQQKPSDEYVLPLTPGEHQMQHQMNEREFWEGHGIDALKLAARLYGVWNLTKDKTHAQEHMRRIIMEERE